MQFNNNKNNSNKGKKIMATFDIARKKINMKSIPNKRRPE